MWGLSEAIDARRQNSSLCMFGRFQEATVGAAVDTNRGLSLIRGWLLLVCATIVLMVGVGGATRLTHSGLSMVDWKPITGILPPLNAAEWEAEFAQYKQYPEYQKLNRGMTLEGFKTIFYWEYGHRILGRAIGLIYALPFLYFWLSGSIERRFLPRFWIALGLGGSQGLLGWYMVKSGLVDRPSVSHFRLAAHLCLALFILAYIFDLFLTLGRTAKTVVPMWLRSMVLAFTILLVLQLIYGGFTAGLKAGLGFNSYPKMGEQWIADAALTLMPFWTNLIDNGAMIQFIHRWLGLAVVISALMVCIAALRWGASARLTRAACLCVGLVAVQFLLGVTTLVLVVPLNWALSHQVFACFLVLGLVYLNYLVRPQKA